MMLQQKHDAPIGVRVKICGIRNLDDALAAATLGADALGFHIGLEGARAPVTEDIASQIIRKLPDSVSGVVVTSISEPQKLILLAQSTGAKILQLYGDVTPDDIHTVKSAIPAVEIWKVVHVDENTPSRVKAYEDAADAIVLDSRNRETGQRGGTGKTHDWSVSRRIVDSISIPVILAGGLNPDNVADAIKTVAPSGVDVNSGITHADGSKDLQKVKKFIASAKTLL